MPTPNDTPSPATDPVDPESLPMAKVVDASLPMAKVVGGWRARSGIRPPAPYRPSMLRRVRFVLLILSLPALLGAGYVFWYDNTPTRLVMKVLSSSTPEQVWGLMTEESKKNWDDWARQLARPGTGFDLFREKTEFLRAWERFRASEAKFKFSEERTADGRALIRVEVDRGSSETLLRYTTLRYEARRVWLFWRLHHPIVDSQKNETD